MRIKSQNKNRLLIFMHMPKTAGTTLGQIFRKQYANQVCGGGAQKDTIGKLSALSDAEINKLKCIWGHIPFGIHNYFKRPYIYITMLRDPVERIISMYYYLYHNTKIKWINGLSFKEFLSIKSLKPKIENLQTRFLSWESRIINYKRTEKNLTSFMLDSNQGEPNLERAKKNINDYFAIVGITELFDESISLIKRELGWDDIDYTKKNVNSNRPAKDQLPVEIISMIKEKNKLDIELYDYAKKKLEDNL
ncbi:MULTISPECIES: sulfotransferase family 2 domain-containing protein [unclassified Candidatus Frackibacter]|uniref:sulfotransferase family 2 domain-containing protein n=1 Tax=unclassified Candidatus Frackibacter TaxID=2648818 RepID=UPI00088B4299|nr:MULTISPECIES: sulfotransferase family 2 domain-containing protein [unclassified Candidatus Frackibacter]SDC82643.1 Sulfotransferase family protein [Candidatus Frackibacter sp. WG11]SEM97118.1 Sulfotransferase family protein [Candidatus Frackibacter sp. WG12]SFM05757.1 Sulfotransferase family protein [Candidatus Frackibacter sp. WG13]